MDEDAPTPEAQSPLNKHWDAHGVTITSVFVMNYDGQQQGTVEFVWMDDLAQTLDDVMRFSVPFVFPKDFPNASKAIKIVTKWRDGAVPVDVARGDIETSITDSQVVVNLPTGRGPGEGDHIEPSPQIGPSDEMEPEYDDEEDLVGSK